MATFIVKNTEPSTNPDLVETITPDHFGVNYLVNQLPVGTDPVAQVKLTTALSKMGASNLRWPGGTVTETQFDFRNENATTANGSSMMPQHDFFAVAGQLHADVTLVLQSRSAFGAAHSAALALADGTYGNRTVDPGYIADLKAYVLRSLLDADAAGTRIRLFEIGNEFWGGAEMTATEYGRVARAVLTAVDQVLTAHLLPGEARPDIAIQSAYAAGYMSPNGAQTVYVQGGVVDNQPHVGWTPYTIASQGTSYTQVMKIADEVTGVAEGGPNLSRLVTGMIDHYYPKSGLAFVDGEIDAFLFRQMNSMEKRLGFAYGTLERNITEWNPIRYVDLNGDGLNDNAAANRGMPQAAEMLDLLYEMVTHGVHTANVWPLYFDKAYQTNLVEASTYALRVPGQTFKLMQESLIGTKPEYDFMETRGAITMDVHGYTDAHRLVLMVSNQSSVASPDTVLDVSTVSSSATGAALSGSYFITSTRLNSVDANANPDPGINTADVTPVLSTVNGMMSTGALITEGTMASWDLMRTEITFVTAGADFVQGRAGNDTMNGLAGNDTLLGDLGNDSLSGGDGNDSLSGGAGNDNLTGLKGNDTLYGDTGDDYVHGGLGNDSVSGGDGNDTVVGGNGNDVLTGGLGRDTFIFGETFGKDTLTDFSHAQGDVIDLSGLTGSHDLTSFAGVQAHLSTVGGIVHFTMASMDIAILGVTQANLVSSDFVW